MDAGVERLRGAVLAAGEALQLNVRRRRHIGRLRSVDGLDPADRLRGPQHAGAGPRRGHPQPEPAPVPADLGAALRSLAEAVRSAGDALAADLTGQDEIADRHAERADRPRWPPSGSPAGSSPRARPSPSR